MAARAVEYIAPFKALPWAIPAWRDKFPALVFEGGAGGGKSITAANKCHAYCLKYPGAVVAVLRKERAAHINSTMPMFQRWVLGNDPRVTVVFSKHRVEYDNGSMLLFLGMADAGQRERVRSMSFDMAWLEEATQFEEADYNEVLARMRGAAGAFRQIVLTTNPDGPNHWMKRRLIDGKEAHVYLSSAKDNPYLPHEYHASLAQMTGVQRQRLLEGRWTQAEGVIYDNWTYENITHDAEYNPAYGSVYWGIDDGYVYGGGPGTLSYHPRVVLLAQITPIGGLNVFAEYYRALELAESTISAVSALDYPAPEMVYVDSSAAELRARLTSGGLANVGATHNVAEGIKNLRRMICDGNGQRLFRVHPRCANLIREVQTYRYADSEAGEPRPEKLDDHGCLVAGTLVDTERGAVEIERVVAGDRVMTRKGYQRVIAAGMTNPRAQVYEVRLSNGRTLVGTGNHPVFTQENGYTRLDSLRYGDIIRTNVLGSEVLRWPNQTLPFARKSLSSTGSYSGAIQTQSAWKTGATSSRTQGILSAASKHCTVKSGRRTTGLFRRAGTSIIRTGIQAITALKTSIAYRGEFISLDTLHNQSVLYGRGATSGTLAPLQLSGTGAMLAANGIDSTGATFGRMLNPFVTPAISAAQSSKQSRSMTLFASVQTTASRHGGGLQGLMMRIGSALNVARSSVSTATAEPSVVADHVQRAGEIVYVESVTQLVDRYPVFNLTVDAVPEYFANGVLVHNCDCARYLAWQLRYTGV